jgi:hypothetical protein
MFLIIESKDHNGHSSEYNVEDLVNPFFVEYLPGESRIKTEPELGHYKEHILIECIAH